MKQIQILGDQISDVYIDNFDITQNQEIIDCTTYKGKYNNVKILPGGTGCVVSNLLTHIKYLNYKISDQYLIKYLLPQFSITHDNGQYFNYNSLFDKSLKYIYNSFNNDYFQIINMQPIDYISDIIQPTVKIRFMSTLNKKVYFRFDNDNTINMKNINCDYVFSNNDDDENNMVLVDYDKGYFNSSTVTSLLTYIKNNNIKLKNLFINVKPKNIKYFKSLLEYCNKIKTTIYIQLNEFEFEPIKDDLLNSVYKQDYLVVTHGIKPIKVYDKTNNYTSFDVIELNDAYVFTTSGAGDCLFSSIIFNVVFNELSMENVIKNSINEMPYKLGRLNSDILYGW